jgi:phosphonopyruvate decarboxylase
MINPAFFYTIMTRHQVEFFTGVPDSLLKDICAYITDSVPKKNHVIAANEGNAVALAAGYHMATRKIPLIYMQNSGLGNAVNPLLSLVDEKVYSIPVLLMIGWRGQPGVKDEPQHIKQGAVTIDLLNAMKIPYTILNMDEKMVEQQIQSAISHVKKYNCPYAFVVQKGIFKKYSIREETQASYEMCREDAIKLIISHLSGNEVIVSTTGKTSRELFECRKALNQTHHTDFLTVGSMGHASQIALGIALQKPQKKIICLDGDGALLMHMGGMAIVGSMMPENFIHIVINNGAHESVGGQPTVGFGIDFPNLALANNYKMAIKIETFEQLKVALKNISPDSCPALLEVRVRTGSREDLGRPTIKPVENKVAFMKNLD